MDNFCNYLILINMLLNPANPFMNGLYWLIHILTAPTTITKYLFIYIYIEAKGGLSIENRN